MTITIIGSVGKSSEEMEFLKNKLLNWFHFDDELVVRSPLDDQEGQLIEIQRKFIKKIESADLVIVVSKSKDKLEFGESTSYEIALSSYFCIPVMFFTNFDYITSLKKYNVSLERGDNQIELISRNF